MAQPGSEVYVSSARSVPQSVSVGVMLDLLHDIFETRTTYDVERDVELKRQAKAVTGTTACIATVENAIATTQP